MLDSIAVPECALEIQGCDLTAHVTGGRIPGRGRCRAPAVPFDQFALEPRAAGWHARVVIDI